MEGSVHREVGLVFFCQSFHFLLSFFLFFLTALKILFEKCVGITSTVIM